MLVACLPQIQHEDVNVLLRKRRGDVVEMIRSLNGICDNTKEILCTIYSFVVPKVEFTNDVSTQRQYINGDSIYHYRVPFKGDEIIFRWSCDGVVNSIPGVAVICDGCFLHFVIRDECEESNRKRQDEAIARIKDYIEKMTITLTKFNSELKTIINKELKILDKKLKENL
jgi:hypothetical protein